MCCKICFRTKICYKTLCETSYWAVRVEEFSDLFINLYGGSNPDRAHFFISFFFDSVAVCNTDFIQ